MSALGYPDFQRITQWFGAPLAQAAAAALGAGQIAVGPLDVRSFASVVVCVKPTGGTVTVTVAQLVPGGPVALATSSSFVVADGNVIFEAFVLLAGEVSITFQGSTPGETLAYAIVPANTNTNAEVAALTQLGFQHNDAVVATETAIDLEDAAPIGWTLVDDPANVRVKVTPTLRQNGAATGSLYRWDGAAWTPTAGIIVDDTARKVTFGGDTTLYRAAANTLKTDHLFEAGLDVYAQMGLSTQLRMGNSSGLPTIEFGSAFDTRIYRASAQNLNTDGNFSAAYTIQVDRLNGGGKLYFGSALDTNLYRAGAAYLKTDGLLEVGNSGAGAAAFQSRVGAETYPRWEVTAGGIVVWGDGTGQDTNLYRAAAATLKTDGQLWVGSQVIIGSFTDPNGAPHVGFANSGGILATPTGGGCLFVDAGALKYRGSAGSVTVIAPA